MHAFSRGRWVYWKWCCLNARLDWAGNTQEVGLVLARARHYLARAMTYIRITLDHVQMLVFYSCRNHCFVSSQCRTGGQLAHENYLGRGWSSSRWSFF